MHNFLNWAYSWSNCFHIQGPTWEGRTAQGWHYTHSILCDCLPLQLCLLCFPWLPLWIAHFLLLDMLAVPELRLGPTARFRPIRARNRRFRARLVHHLILPRKPACKPMVCHCQCSRGIFFHHVCFDPHLLLAQCLQGQNLSDIFGLAIHIKRPSVQHHFNCWFQFPSRHCCLWTRRATLPKHFFCNDLWSWFCSTHGYNCTCRFVSWKVTFYIFPMHITFTSFISLARSMCCVASDFW